MTNWAWNGSTYDTGAKSSEYGICTSGFDGEKFDAESTELTVRIASKLQSSG
jgi:hypothetical protein